MVRYYTDDTKYRYPDKRLTARWLAETAAAEGYALGDVNYIFCSSQRLLEMNRQYLGHDYFTDVITFDYSDRKETRIVSGDVFIDVETVADNARQYGATALQEMRRVIVHGVLHLCGQGDKTPRTNAQMHRKEDKYLEWWNRPKNSSMGRIVRTLIPFFAALALWGCAGAAQSKTGQAESDTRTAATTALSAEVSAAMRTVSEEQRGGMVRKVPFERGDTLFFCDFSRCDSTTGFRDFCRGYVDKNRFSAHYENIRAAAALDSGRNRRDFEELASALREKYLGEIRRFDLRGCPEVWQQLASVAGEYYLDDRTVYPVWITDSLLVEQMQDGPWPSLFERFENPAAGHYRFRTRTLHGEARSFDLRIIDSLRGIGILVEHDGADERYRLLAAGKASPHFDLLVWESAELPSGNEIPYDDIDFEALTKQLPQTTAEERNE